MHGPNTRSYPTWEAACAAQRARCPLKTHGGPTALDRAARRRATQVIAVNVVREHGGGPLKV